MQIQGTEGLSSAEVVQRVRQGARFVIYQYCVSLLVITFKRSSDIHFVAAGQGSVGKGLGFSALTLVLGWWGIPWGPIYTVQSLWVNFRGGRDVTQEMLAHFGGSPGESAPIARATGG